MIFYSHTVAKQVVAAVAQPNVSGQVWMAYNEVLTDDEVANGRILVCQSYPVGGDVIIEF